MTIRRLTAADAPQLRALWSEGLRDTPQSFLLTPQELAAIRDEPFAAGLDESLFFGAFDTDTLIGFVVARPGALTRLNHTADIGPLYVTPAHQRRGHARALMTTVMEQLRAAGILQCELALDAENTAADRLYTSLGFIPFGRRPRSVIIDGTARTDLLMICALDGTELT